MITLKLGEKTFEIKGNMFTQFVEAAPAMDRIIESVPSESQGGSTVAMVKYTADMLEALAPFIEGETRESLMAVAGVRDVPAISDAFIANMQYLGLFPPPAAVEDAPAPDAVAA
jgi:hypothetical protein